MITSSGSYRRKGKRNWKAEKKNLQKRRGSLYKEYRARLHAESVAKFKAKMKKYTRRSWGVGNDYKVKKLNELIRGGLTTLKLEV